MDPPATQTNLDNNLLSQFLSFIPNLQALSQQSGSQNNPGLSSFLAAVQPGTNTQGLAALLNSTPSVPSAASSQPLPPLQPAVQAQPLGFAPASVSNNTVIPPAPAAAPITPYTSVQMLNAVASSSSSSSSSSSPSPNPGHSRVTTSTGFPSLSLVQRANAQRPQHARDSLPQSGLKKKKPRGKAKRPPSLISQNPAPTIDSCLAYADGDLLVVNLQVNVYPPQPPTSTTNELGLPRHLSLYQRNRESFHQALTYLNLTFRFPNLPTNTLVIDLIGNIIHQLRSSGYDLPSLPSRSSFALHEQLALQLLGYTNLGRPNTITKTPRLVTTSITSTTTIHDILANKREYSNPKLSVTLDNYFELNMIVWSSLYPLELNTSLMEVKLGTDEEPRVHRCISKRIYGLFQSDIDARISEGVGSLDEDEIEASCDEGDDETEASVDEERVVAQALTIASASTTAIAPITPRASPVPALITPRASPVPAPISPPAPATIEAAGPVTRGASARVSEFPVSHQAPQPLWDTERHEQQIPGLDTIFTFERTSRIFEVVSEAYTTAHGGAPPPSLRITGTDYNKLSESLRDVIVLCIRAGDFTMLLSGDRHFILQDRHGRQVSSGSGIEREAIHTLCKRYLIDRADQFFTPLMGEYQTIAISPGLSSRWMSDDQQLEWGVLGAVVALALIYGMGTEPLNPLLLIYFINDCELGCLTSRLVSEWFPSLHDTIVRWKSLGPNDNVSEFSGHFATYHDLQVSALTGRSSEMHIALASEMLYSAIVGKRGPGHPVFTCFLKGFVMPCDLGYSFTQLARVFHGGSEAFVSSVYQNFITSYHSLRLHTVAASFEDFFRLFLEGVGYPDVDLMEAEEGRFSPLVNFDNIHSDNFRMRMLCWAATGAPFVLPEGPPIKIILVEDNDSEYGATLSRSQLERALNAGVCKFRTCIREMRVPASFILQILRTEYPGDSELDARIVLHHWLLVSLLDNISQATLA
ncbi:hypothetical protein V5O48_011516 [Marasmius crinis-equi]|uniref:HECT domain-containing protein n=1 Tax=Marasmius crinis-equi TaxID=585013 RepID=A0ABR3F5E5_9AGAR